MLNRLRDVFASLQKHDVHYVVIGGVAAVLHGVPRATFDLDVLIEATEENVSKLLEALTEAGLGTATMTSVQNVLSHEITVSNDRVRIDVQTSTPGLIFSTAWNSRESMTYQGQVFFVVSVNDLIKSKRASGRPQDLEDIRMLEQTA